MHSSAEIKFLLSETAKVFGQEIRTSSDFDRLAEAIELSVGQPISVSTLKRLWGYVGNHPKPRISTLDIMCQYIGRRNFRELCLELKESSDFIVTKVLKVSDLTEGNIVEITWLPDRIISLEYKGDMRFVILDAGTSKLKEGDLVETSAILLGQPLYLNIIRDGNELPVYVAGKASGITSVSVL